MKLHNEDCIVQMQKMIDAGIQVDSVVTDPPYELGFMGKSWDSTGIAFQKETWELALQLLKPGGHLLAFAGSRTYHRIAVAIEDAGFEIRDQLMWLYGSGFPKSHNIGKAVDKLQGNEREDLGEYEPFGREGRKSSGKAKFGAKGWETKPKIRLTKGNSEHEGWGTALKPAHEPVVMARKPLAENTVAENVLKHGTGGINVDGCRIPLDGERPPSGSAKRVYKSNQYTDEKTYGTNKTTPESGRYPANVIHDGLEQEWARFFYCAKVSKNERNGGLDGFETKKMGMSNGAQSNGEGYDKGQSIGLNRVIERKNTHPTVKPQVLMKYLCRLVTPKSGTVLDPFMGSGSTGMAAKDEGFDFIGIEQEKEYFEIAKQRIKIISPLNEFFEKYLINP